MAISNLVTPGKKIDLPSVSMFFGGKATGSANDNMQKVSSTMLSDSMVSAITDALKTFTSEIAKLQETSTAAVRSFVNIIKSLKELNKDITFKFKALGAELNASRLDFVRNILTDKNIPAPVQTALASAVGESPAQPDKPEPPKPGPGPLDIIETLMDALGLARGAGKARFAAGLARFAAFLVSPAALTAGIIALGAGGTGYLIYQAAELYKQFLTSEEFEQWKKGQEGKTEEEQRQEGATRARERADAARRQQITKDAQTTAALITAPDGTVLNPAKDLAGRRKNKEGHEIWELNEDVAKKFGFVAINTVTGERFSKVLDRTIGKFEGVSIPGTSRVGAPTSNLPSNAPDTGSSSATGAGEGGENLNRVTDTVPPTGSAPSSAPAAPATPPAAPAASPTPAAPAAAPAGGGAGAPQRNSSPGGGGEPLNTATAQHWMLNHPDVAAAYAALNSADKKRAAEMAATGQESEARNFVLSRGSVPKTLPAQMLTGGAQTVQGLEPAPAAPASTPVPTAPPPPAATPAADKRASNEPVVINNNSTQTASTTEGGEGNNIAGQNFAMFVTDPFLNEYLQRQNVPYA
jgi:hypothetical protein